MYLTIHQVKDAHAVYAKLYRTHPQKLSDLYTEYKQSGTTTAWDTALKNLVKDTTKATPPPTDTDTTTATNPNRRLTTKQPPPTTTPKTISWADITDDIDDEEPFQEVQRRRRGQPNKNTTPTPSPTYQPTATLKASDWEGSPTILTTLPTATSTGVGLFTAKGIQHLIETEALRNANKPLHLVLLGRPTDSLRQAAHQRGINPRLLPVTHYNNQGLRTSSQGYVWDVNPQHKLQAVTPTNVPTVDLPTTNPDGVMALVISKKYAPPQLWQKFHEAYTTAAKQIADAKTAANPRRKGNPWTTLHRLADDTKALQLQQVPKPTDADTTAPPPTTGRVYSTRLHADDSDNQTLSALFEANTTAQRALRHISGTNGIFYRRTPLGDKTDFLEEYKAETYLHLPPETTLDQALHKLANSKDHRGLGLGFDGKTLTLRLSNAEDTTTALWQTTGSGDAPPAPRYEIRNVPANVSDTNLSRALESHLMWKPTILRTHRLGLLLKRVIVESENPPSHDRFQTAQGTFIYINPLPTPADKLVRKIEDQTRKATPAPWKPTWDDFPPLPTKLGVSPPPKTNPTLKDILGSTPVPPPMAAPAEAPPVATTAPPPEVRATPTVSLDEHIAAAVQQSEARLEKMIQSLLGPLLQAQNSNLQVVHLPRNDPKEDGAEDNDAPKAKRHREDTEMQAET